MQPVWICISSSKRFEATFENSIGRWIMQMQSMKLCICLGRFSEAPFQKKMWLKSFPDDNLDDTFWCAHLREVGQIQLEWNEYGEDDEYDENDEEELAQVGWLPGAGGSKETPTSHQWCCWSWTLFATLSNLVQVMVKYLQLYHKVCCAITVV